MEHGVKKPIVSASIKVTDPEDFSKDALVYRRNVLLSTSLAFLLVMSEELNPSIMGVKISPVVMWSCLSVAHVYQFIMWRLTSPIEMDSEKNLLNINGLFRQAFFKGTKKFPSKTKAQLIMLRALPILAFTLGAVCILIGFWQCFR